jgi:hypothetical protein
VPEAGREGKQMNVIMRREKLVCPEEVAQDA